MKKANFVEYHELLQHATTLGYDWNHACEFMDSLRPQYEVRTITFHVDELGKKETDEGFDEDFDIIYPDELNHVMKSFLKNMVLTKFRLLNRLFHVW